MRALTTDLNCIGSPANIGSGVWSPMRKCQIRERTGYLKVESPVAERFRHVVGSAIGGYGASGMVLTPLGMATLSAVPGGSSTI